MTEKKINLPQPWLELLDDEFDKPYMTQLRAFVANEYKNHAVYPPKDKIFNALNATLPQQIRVVIIGQDPYHGPGQANGLCFSVNKGVDFPPSLRNIFKELQSDIGIAKPTSGDLSPWAAQGVLLLNATLTVRGGQANSHQQCGWGAFTDRIIYEINRNCTQVVYLLWGSFAQAKAAHVDPENNFVLKSVHPSPLSAHNGFFGCKHFSKANHYLAQAGKQPIDWRLP